VNLEVDQRHEYGGVHPGQIGVVLSVGQLFVILDPVGMRSAFHHRKAGVQDRAKQGCADLANSTAYTGDGLTTHDNQSFGVAVIQADIAKRLSHREGLTRRHQHAVKARSSRFDVSGRAQLEKRKNKRLSIGLAQ